MMDSKRRRRCASCSSQMFLPRSNSAKPSERPNSAFQVSDRNAKSALYMSLRRSGSSSMLQLYNKNNVRGQMPPYFSFQDPHLKDFYLRKFFAIAKNDLLRCGLLNTNSFDVPNERRARAKKIKPESNHEAKYTVSVTTGKHVSAGTSAKVFISLHGLRGKIMKKRLKKGNSSHYSFQRGKVQSFKFGGPDVGIISYVTIEHDGVLEDDGWFLEEVKVIKAVDMKSTSFTFPCHDWLSLHESDGLIRRKLHRTSSENKSSLTNYQVVVMTGDRKGAGTDAHVFLTIFGTLGQTDRTHLNNPIDGESFERNTTSMFNLNGRNVGIIKKIRIEHDNSGFAPGWFLDKVIVAEASQPAVQYFFPCNQWLAKDEEDGSTHRDLLASTDASATSQKPKKYKILVYTGDKRGAGTDANVTIQIFGSQGDSGTRKLDARFKNDFERNKLDEFIIESIDLGDLKRLRIGHDNSGPSPGWYLDRVEIVDEERNKKYEFNCQRWLATDEDDGETYRDLTCKSEKNEPGFPFELKIKTGDVMGAGTSAKVFVVMFGSGADEFGDADDMEIQRRKAAPGLKSSGKLWLTGCKFERNRTDVCRIEVMEDLSPLSKIEIGHDNKGITPGWFLDEVVVTCLRSGLEQTFFCKNWLAANEGDGLIERTLTESGRNIREKKITWSVRVHTCDERGSGTDANVFIVLYGREKKVNKNKKSDTNALGYLKTKDIQLCNKGNNFESGQVDEFTVEMEDVGIPFKVRVWHDNSKPFASWKLQKIAMENHQTCKEYIFPCNRWLSADEEDKEIIRELPAIANDADKPFEVKKYKVYIHTGKVFGAGTDANVFLCIFGENGDTGDRPLTRSLNNRNKFERGQTDEFVIEAVDLKKLEMVRVGHDGRSSGSGWFLDKVVIQQEKESEKATAFECNRWLDVKEDDGQIVRELCAGEIQMLKTTSYHISVRTGTCRHAGTDANVYIQLFGSSRSTGKLGLSVSENGSKNKFESGRIDLFKIEAVDIGEIKKIIIGHDGSGVGSGWFLDEVTIKVPTRGENYVFPCNRWLDKNEDDGKIDRELFPEREGNSKNVDKCVPYCITIWTGSKTSAGTDANVFIQMYGDLGKSEEIQLRTKSDNFEKGSVDVFKIEAIDVGNIFKIRIGHDGTGMFSGWFLHKVLIQSFKAYEKKIEAQGKPRHRMQSKRKSDVYLKKKTVLDKYDKNNFKNKKMLTQNKSVSSSCSENDDDYDYDDYLTKDVQNNYSPQLQVSEQDNNFKSSDNEEDLDEKENIREYWFICDKWFASSKDDGKISRELLPTTAEGNVLKNSLSEVIYIIKVFTGSKFGAGTDANVYLKLSGSAGDSGEIHLKDSNNANKFERKQLDIFKLPIVDLGTLTKLQIRHDNKGGNAGWFLDHIEVEDTKHNSSYYFECKKWLAVDEDDGQLSRVLLPKINNQNAESEAIRNVTDKSLKDASEKLTTQTHTVTTYRVRVFTGNKFGAGTDANVHIILFGEKDDTGKVLLKNSKLNKNKFERNQVDEFSIEAANLGDLKKIKIGHDNTGFGGAWFLDKVEVDIPSIEKQWIFPHSRWIAKDKDDGKLEHEIYAQRCKE